MALMGKSDGPMIYFGDWIWVFGGKKLLMLKKEWNCVCVIFFVLHSNCSFGSSLQFCTSFVFVI